MERPTNDPALVQAAHVIARGGELDRKLDALAEAAQSLSGAGVAVIYVLDPVTATVVPAAAAGVDLETLSDGGSLPIADPEALVARVVRERRRASSGSEGPATGGALADFRTAVALPLVYADDAGTEEAEGALLVAYDDRPTDEDGTDEALAALADLCAVAIRQARLEHTLRERAEWMSRVASSDALTGLPNRTTFERMLELELARSTRQQTELSVVLFDVDGLAAINDRHGAHVGDDVLRATASLLADQIRLVDGAARIGPDEFGLVAPSGGGAVVARRIRDAASRVSLPSGVELSLSAAVVVFPHDGATTVELMSRAAEVMAEAQAAGPGAVVATRELQA
jgi:two-component system, cell cycle response regulator